MRSASAWLTGEFDPWPSRDELARILGDGGLRLEVDEYSVRILDGPGIVFDHLDDFVAPMVTADTADVQALVDAATRVSAILAANDIAHRLEVHRADGKLAAYLHHGWNSFDLYDP
jgi:hypothetical protein